MTGDIPWPQTPTQEQHLFKIHPFIRVPLIFLCLLRSKFWRKGYNCNPRRR